MKTSFKIIILALAAAVACAAGAADKYTFSYRTTGEPDLKPVQVFDDGSKTFLQMKGSVVPVVFVGTGDKATMVQVSKAGQYLVVPAVSDQLTLKYATLSARIAYSGPARNAAGLADGAEVKADGKVVAVTNGATDPKPQTYPAVYGAAKPLIGDTSSDYFLDRDALVSFTKGSSSLSKDAAAKVLSALAGPGAPVKVLITGRDDQAYVEGLARARGIAIRDRVIAAGVPLERIVVKEGVARDGESKFVTSDMVVTWQTSPERKVGGSVQVAQQAAPVNVITESHGKWSMTMADKTISSMLARWATSEGWTLVWKSELDPAITGEAVIVGDHIEDAVKVVVAQSNKFGYPLTLEAKNKVLTIK